MDVLTGGHFIFIHYNTVTNDKNFSNTLNEDQSGVFNNNILPIVLNEQFIPNNTTTNDSPGKLYFIYKSSLLRYPL